MASRTLRSNSKVPERPLRSSVVTRNAKIPATRGRPPLLKSKEKQQAEKTKGKVAEKVTEKVTEKATEKVTEKATEKVKDQRFGAKENKTEVPVKNTETEKNDEPLATVIIKRKRGRPRNTSYEVTPVAKKQKEDDEQSRTVDIKQKDNSKKTNNDVIPLRRQPRMASLNAIAKVNAVLESYRTDKTASSSNKDNSESIIQKNSEHEQNAKTSQDSALMSVGKNQEINKKLCKKTIPPSSSTNATKFTRLNVKLQLKNRTNEPVSDIVKIVPEILPPPSPVEMHDQAIQTESFYSAKAIQTESFIFPKDRTLSLCTCNKTSTIHTGYYENKYSSLPGKPVHIKGSVLSRCGSYTLAVPVVKKHVYYQEPPKYTYKGMTDGISSLLDHCIKRNFTRKSVYPACAKLLYVAAQKQSLIKKQQKMNGDNSTNAQKGLGKIVVPKLNIDTISIPNSKVHKLNGVGNSNGHVGGSTNNYVTKKQVKTQKTPKFTDKKKKCNGWQFDCESFQETYHCGKELITRKYYECVSRNDDTIKVYDAVVLKSGLGTPESDFVARISSFWEDDIGQFAGEMMMSVQWYYKPEQTISKGNEVIRGENMEVFASRHKDDNSVACIIDRCYVVTFSQFCRFKAQRQLFVENRKNKLAMVPQGNTNRSRFIPSPDFDPELVFFCRFGYDYRSGKLIKSQV